MEHEARQARAVGDRLGGGEFHFDDHKEGVEGFLNELLSDTFVK
jgi:hypothetical protein